MILLAFLCLPTVFSILGFLFLFYSALSSNGIAAVPVVILVLINVYLCVRGCLSLFLYASPHRCVVELLRVTGLEAEDVSHHSTFGSVFTLKETRNSMVLFILFFSLFSFNGCCFVSIFVCLVTVIGVVEAEKRDAFTLLRLWKASSEA